MKIHTCLRDARLMQETMQKQTETIAEPQPIAQEDLVEPEIIVDEPIAIAEPEQDADKEEVKESACKARSKKKA